jgi:hypothetical protein
MSFTRFYYDDCRVKKQLQQQTDPGRWILNVPGNGAMPGYIEDPQIIIQKWGANLRTNPVDLESDLFSVNRFLSRDCLGKDEYSAYNVPNKAVSYPNNNKLFTEQSRAIAPAWMVRDCEQVDWYYPPLNPQENTCMPFLNNLNTRILEKDYFTPTRDCVITEGNVQLPTNAIKGRYVGGPNTCSTQKSCEAVKNN